MSTDMAVIEAALKAAREADGGWPWYQRDAVEQMLESAPSPIAGDMLAADAHLIANAPTWLAELVERVKVAEAAIERVRALADRFKAGGFTSVYESAQELGEMIADALDGDA